MKFATFVSLLLLIALVGCTLPAGQYSASVYLPDEIVFGGVTTPTQEALPTWTAPTAAPPTPSPLRYITNITNSTYNIRRQPSINSEDLGNFKPGEQLEFQFDYEMDIGWIGVAWDGGTAFVSKACCEDHQ